MDKRPQGRNFLYAQCAVKGATLNRDGTLAGPLQSYTLPTKQTASLPALSFQSQEFVGRKVPSEQIPDNVKTGNVQIPGYTGHLHGMQHIFGLSFGETSHRLKASAKHTMRSSLELLDFGDYRPQAPLLQGDGDRIPGYTGKCSMPPAAAVSPVDMGSTTAQVPGTRGAHEHRISRRRVSCALAGHIPAKDRHIYGHTYGQSTLLAQDAVSAQKAGEPAGALPQLVDHRPQGRVDLYTQKKDADLAATGGLRERTAVLPPHLKMTVDK